MSRVIPVANWTAVPNAWLRDKNLSAKALGILIRMNSLPPDWEFSINGLAAIMKEGAEAISAAIKELEKLGYVTREKQTREGGKFSQSDYKIHESPYRKKPSTENPSTVNPSTENPAQYNIRLHKKDIQKKEQSKIVATQSCDVRAIQLANRLYKWIVRNKPNRKIAKGWEQRWARDIDLMHREDKRDWNDIAKAIDWSQQNDFWWCNILSGKKLREHFDDLESQYTRERGKNSSADLWAKIDSMTPEQLMKANERINSGK